MERGRGGRGTVGVAASRGRCSPLPHPRSTSPCSAVTSAGRPPLVTGNMGGGGGGGGAVRSWRSCLGEVEGREGGVREAEGRARARRGRLPNFFRSRFTHSLFQGSDLGVCLCQRVRFRGRGRPPRRRRGARGDVGLKPPLKVDQKGAQVGVQNGRRRGAVICGVWGGCFSARNGKRRACDAANSRASAPGTGPTTAGCVRSPSATARNLARPARPRMASCATALACRQGEGGELVGGGMCGHSKSVANSTHALSTCTSSPQNSRHSPSSTAAKPRTKSSHRGGLRK